MTKAIIFAAGRGQRMKNLTEDIPKALLEINGKTLIEQQIENLTQAGIKHIVINLAYRGEQIREYLGNGRKYNASIHYSQEPEQPYETGGAIIATLNFLGDEPFIATSCDILTDYPYATLLQQPIQLAHIVLVDNPSWHPSGDFSLSNTAINLDDGNKFTYSNIGIYHPRLFQPYPLQRIGLGAILREHIPNGLITGEHYQGHWQNVNTPEDLTTLANKH